ncbi:MAG: hypothetical protein HYR62_08520 [Actinobacteria bacterium]|nr:hypothetical protein [Actinomycetota bacterium]MBI3686208.1 hypothetical protein [Actinomycetota bacterium]
MSVELAGFVLPAMLISIILVAVAFRLAVTRLDLNTASASAARAASLQHDPTSAITAAQQAAESNLTARAITCTRLTVTTDTSRWHRGGAVTVTVGCTISLRRMGGFAGQVTATSTSTAPIDTYRPLAQAPVWPTPGTPMGHPNWVPGNPTRTGVRE